MMEHLTLFDYPDPWCPTDTPLASWPDVLLALLLDAWAGESGT